MQLPTPVCAISHLLYFFFPLQKVTVFVYFPVECELRKAENFCFSFVSWSIPRIPDRTSRSKLPQKYLLSELVVLNPVVVFSLSRWSCLPCRPDRAQGWEHHECLVISCPTVDKEAVSSLHGADHTLKSSDPPEQTGTGFLEWEGSLGSSGAWGKLRPRVEERLSTVIKPVGSRARASGDSDSGLSYADAKGPTPGRHLPDNQAHGTTPHTPHPCSWAGVLLGQSPPWRRGSHLGHLPSRQSLSAALRTPRP